MKEENEFEVVEQAYDEGWNQGFGYGLLIGMVAAGAVIMLMTHVI